MSDTALRILIVDDDQVDRMALRRSITKSGMDATVLEVETGAAALEETARSHFDCALIDQRLSDTTGLDLLGQIRLRPGRPPALILMSGAGDELLAASALKGGADDYLPKDALSSDTLQRAVRSVVEVARLRATTEALEQDRRAERAMLQKAERMAGIGSWQYDLVNDKMSWSDGMFSVLGLKRSTFTPCRMVYADFLSEDSRNEYFAAYQRLLDDGTSVDLEHVVQPGDRHVHYVAHPLYDESGALRGASGMIQDLTERKRVEQTLEHAKRIQTVGALAGGIAHDFNNLLGIISGNLELLGRLVGDQPNAAKRINVLQKAARRGGVLTSRLLNFSDLERNAGEPTDVNAVLGTMDELLCDTLPDGIDLKIYAAPDLWPTDIVAGDLEDAILNMVLNARDAMPEGGRLVIETANKRSDRLQVGPRRDDIRTDWVVLSISDTGHGISPEVKSRVLEPFFTTKPKSEGSGLGLSMVYGFVKRSDGLLQIDSNPGSGTTIQIHLPRSVSDEPTRSARPAPGLPVQATDSAIAGDAAAEDVVAEMLVRPAILPKATSPESRLNSATVLVVDDESELLDVVAEMLRSLGYRTLTASSGQGALDILEMTPVSLVLSDVVMPGGMNGVELGREIRDRWPALPVQLTSGYSAEVAKSFGDDPLLDSVLPKPCSMDELSDRVRQRLLELWPAAS
ncbi:response regulator [Thalassobaculum sp.]|uniref:response regulator n=1 Tax=Thalassobaculum sp. TaxID=2022740 RepID=UPI0032EEC2B5